MVDEGESEDAPARERKLNVAALVRFVCGFDGAYQIDGRAYMTSEPVACVNYADYASLPKAPKGEFLDACESVVRVESAFQPNKAPETADARRS